MSLMDRISNLHLLLQVPSFCRWPLEVRFFCEDVYQKWQVFSEASKSKVGSNIAVVLDARATNGVLEEPSAAPQKQSATGKGGMEGIEASYAPLKEHLQKSMGLLTEHDTMQCTLCGSSIDDSRRATVCPHDGCTATSHLSCISRHFLEEEKQDSLLPTVGKCPSCRRQTRWVDLVKEVTLRLRGKKEVVSLLKVRKSRVSKKKALVTEPANVSHAEYYSLDDDDEELEEDDEEVGAPYKLDMVDEPHWYEATATMDLDDDDLLSITSAASDAPKFSPQRGLSTSTYRRQDLDIVIEDSDWDSAEVLD
ncbi:MAG: Slx4p interacting protein [Icmadophila ericetorum]|nr:Slx4p interacting protein [Icmadophila ericetorum]